MEEVGSLLVVSADGSTLSNCSRASSAFGFLFTKLVKSSMEKRRVTWVEAVAKGNFCGTGIHQ